MKRFNWIRFVCSIGSILIAAAVATAATSIVKVNVLEERTNHFTESFRKIDAKLDSIEKKLDTINGN